MSELVKAIVDHLNNDCDLSGSELYYEVLEGTEIDDAYKEYLTFDFNGTEIFLGNYKMFANHVDGDGGDIALWLEVEDNGQTYYVGQKGRYNSWDGDYFDDNWKIGKVRTWTESMFY